ncbi:MAG: hypothetical protein E7660_00840 [Ruminococcaceae bacterium]|nr:hypothetical protein [Oscillospiraceae bacterium]
MKKIGLFLCFVVVVLTFASCNSVSRPLLDYQNGLASVSARIETGGAEYAVEIFYNENGASLEIKEPENIGGVTFSRENGAFFASSGDMKIPLSPELFSKVEPILDAFLLSPDNIASITKDESGNTVYSVSADDGVYTLFITPEGKPSSIAYEGERTFTVSDIVLKKMS